MYGPYIKISPISGLTLFPKGFWCSLLERGGKYFNFQTECFNVTSDSLINTTH
jgi:hypothetical protein